MMLRKSKNFGLASQLRKFFSANPPKNSSLSELNIDSAPIKREFLQFTKGILTEWGDLPLGEIPSALKFDRPNEFSVSSNGIRVMTESFPSELSSIVVKIKAGSRDETIETSGVAHFLEHLHLCGTKNRTKLQLRSDLENIGGQIQINTDRETTTFSITVLKKDATKAVEILGDILSNSLYNVQDIANEREDIYKECLDNGKDQMACTLENAHYTSYRDHMLGQPVLGIRENVANITQEHVIEYYKTNYHGSNMVIAAAGNVDHKEIASAVESHFGTISKEMPAGLAKKNTEKPYLTPSFMVIRDDEMNNLNVGTFFEAPSWSHKDYFAMLMFEKVLGEYTQDKYTGHHLNKSDQQYSGMHAALGQLPDLTVHKCLRYHYSDTGLIGNYFHGNEVHSYNMLHMGQLYLSNIAKYFSEVEVFRAKNRIYNDLCLSETGEDIANKIACQLLHHGRRIPRSEVARRISHMNVSHLQRVALNWFYDKDISLVVWGPSHTIIQHSIYNRAIRRSTLGWYGDAYYNTH